MNGKAGVEGKTTSLQKCIFIWRYLISCTQSLLSDGGSIDRMASWHLKFPLSVFKFPFGILITTERAKSQLFT